MQRMVRYFTAKPRMLFLADGVGALITACMLALVLEPFSAWFGMPARTVMWLTLTAIGFCFYSIACSWQLRGNWSSYLALTCIMNLLYCIATMALVFYNYDAITRSGIAYFAAEAVLITALAMLETRVLLAIGRKK